MDRARQWWTRRVWWQRTLLVAVVLAIAVAPFLGGGGGAGTGVAGGGVIAGPTTTASTNAPPERPTTTGEQATTVPVTATTRPLPNPGPPAGSEAAFLVAVVDGDTVRIQYGSSGTSEPVRLIGIDAPEIGECFADEATTALEDLLSGFELYMTVDASDRDRFDRLLRYLWLEDGTFINEELVAGGFAIARDFPPDTSYSDRLAAAEDRAAANGSGFWDAGACSAAAS